MNVTFAPAEDRAYLAAHAELRHPGHPDQTVHGSWAHGAKMLHDPDGGFTVDSGGRPIRSGWSVAIEGTSSFMSAEQFESDPASAKAWIREFARGARKGENVGGWHDPKPNSPDQGIVLDKVRIFPPDQRGRAVVFAHRNNQKAIANLDAITAGDWANAIVSTGGSGDTLSDHGEGTAHRSRDDQGRLGDDRGGAGRLRRGDVRRDDLGARIQAVLDELRHPGHEDQKVHGKWATGTNVPPVSGGSAKGGIKDRDLSVASLNDVTIGGKKDGEFYGMGVGDASVKQLQLAGVTQEEAAMNMIRNAEAALARGGPPIAGQNWYKDEGQHLRDAADAAGVDQEIGIAMTATISPMNKWDDNRRGGEVLIAALGRRNERIPDDILTASNATDAAKKMGDSIRPGETLQQVYDRNPRLAAIASTRYGQFTNPPGDNAMVPAGYVHFDRALSMGFQGKVGDTVGNQTLINNTMRGAKVRSFYDNLSDPSNPDVVTIDTHMMRAALNTPGSRDANWQNLQKRQSTLTSTPKYGSGDDAADVGVLPALADSVRGATRAFNEAHGLSLSPSQFQAVVWTEQLAQFPPARATRITMGREIEPPPGPDIWRNQYGSGIVIP